MTTHPFTDLLSSTSPNTLILDGGLGTDLETRGCNLKDPLWSARTLYARPEIVRAVHEDYFRAGAQVGITASYQASTQFLVEQLHITEDEACKLVQRSVHVAAEARDVVLAERAASRAVPEATREPPPATLAAQDKLLIAGSVGPYGAYLQDGSEYRGDYTVSPSGYQSFHTPRMRALLSAGCDVLALETVPSGAETRALLDILAHEFPDAEAWLSFRTRTGDESCLCDGTALADIMPHVNACRQVVAVGVNCVPRESVARALSTLKGLTGKPLLCYPNSGEVYDSSTFTWHGEQGTKGWEELVQEWKAAGARIVGGCCRTGPGDIRVIAECLRRLDAQS